MNNLGNRVQFEQVTSFIQDNSWPKLPLKDRYQAKSSTLDKLGAILAKSRSHITEIVASVAKETWPGDHLT